MPWLYMFGFLKLCKIKQDSVSTEVKYKILLFSIIVRRGLKLLLFTYTQSGSHLCISWRHTWKPGLWYVYWFMRVLYTRKDIMLYLYFLYKLSRRVVSLTRFKNERGFFELKYYQPIPSKQKYDKYQMIISWTSLLFYFSQDYYCYRRKMNNCMNWHHEGGLFGGRLCLFFGVMALSGHV